MPMASGPDRYLVVGNPIAHSRSPEIHAAFAAQTGQHILYERRLIETDPPEAFAAAMRHFFQDEGGRGANVTLPFKEAAFRLADERSPRAEAAGPPTRSASSKAGSSPTTPMAPAWSMTSSGDWACRCRGCG